MNERISEFVASDLLSGEHGANSQVILVTPSGWQNECAVQTNNLLNCPAQTSPARRCPTVAFSSPRIWRNVAVSNEYLPERQIVQTQNARELLPQLDGCPGLFSSALIRGKAWAITPAALITFCRPTATHYSSLGGFQQTLWPCRNSPHKVSNLARAVELITQANSWMRTKWQWVWDGKLW